MGIFDFLFGSETKKTSVPKWQEDAIKNAINSAYQVANLGFTPYRGPDVAAMTPMQMSATQGTNQAASAFGMPTADPMAGMPQAQNYNGMMAYSSAPLYDQALMELKRTNPEQYNALMRFELNRRGGGGGGGGGNGINSNGGGGNSSRNRGNDGVVNTSTGGGYISGRDYFDGGGAGQSGDTFVGGPVSDYLNRIGVQPLRPATPTPVPTPAPVYRPVTYPTTTSPVGRPTGGF